MSTIDLGDSPVGSTPTDAQKTQLRSSIGLGGADTVEFGAIIPPAGTADEINAITGAEVGSVVIDTESGQSVRFTSSSAYSPLGAAVLSSTYYVDPANGSDTKGKAGVFPFATINAALASAELSGEASVSIVCLSGIYTEEDAFNGITATAPISINFLDGSYWQPTVNTSPLFDNTTANLNVAKVGGGLTISNNTLEFWKGSFANTGTSLDIFACLSLSASAPTFDVSGGKGSITFKSKNKANNTAVTREIINVSGGAVIEVRDARFTQQASLAATVPAFVTVSGASTNVSIVNARLLGYGICEITTNDFCNVAIDNCVSAAIPALFFMNQVSQSIAAPSGSTNPTMYAIGNNVIDVAATNITINEDVGSVTVSLTAQEALDKFLEN